MARPESVISRVDGAPPFATTLGGPNRTAVRAARRRIVLVLAVGVLVGAAGLAAISLLPGGTAEFLWPALATLVIFAVFSFALKWRIRANLLAELGFVYMAFGVIYTLFPAAAFVFSDLNPGFLWFLETLGPVQSELSVHLWRHVLFLAGVSAGYLLVRGRAPIQHAAESDRDRQEAATIFSLLVITIVCALLLSMLSGPVETYVDNYTRYDHLSWLPRKIVSLCIRLKMAMYCALIVFLFRNYRKYRILIPFVVVAICAYEMVYTRGARIESLMILLMAVASYSYFVKRISMGRAAAASIVLAVLFSAVETVRNLQFDMTSAADAVLDAGLTPAFEFGAVFWTSLHLYVERAHGALPATEWPMFFYDFISPFTFNDFTDWNPQYWYARAYYPDSPFPPETMGPIADSAIWGGEADLLLRSLINGAFFAYAVRWFIQYRAQWWAVVIYVFFYATCVMTLKYSVFYQLTPLVKTLLPSLLIIGAVRTLRARMVPIRLSGDREDKAGRT